MEPKILAAFRLAFDLALQTPDHMQRDVFEIVFRAMMAGTSANPIQGDADAINALSDNLSKWLATIAEAITNQADPAKLAELTATLKASSDPLQTAVEKQSPQ